MSELSEETKKHLQHQLVKLGDMMGDGLHLEPGGKEIEKDYTRILKTLGMLPKRKRSNHSLQINERMVERIKEVPCPTCNAQLKQTRSGSMNAKCISCGGKYKLLKSI